VKLQLPSPKDPEFFDVVKHNLDEDLLEEIRELWGTLPQCLIPGAVVQGLHRKDPDDLRLHLSQEHLNADIQRLMKEYGESVTYH
jgi:hypothetical protein